MGQPQEPATLVLRVEADGAGKVLVALDDRGVQDRQSKGLRNRFQRTLHP